MKFRYLIFLLLVFVGCGKSPLLEHDKQSAPDGGISGSRQLGNLRLTTQKLAVNYFWQNGPFVYEESKALIVFQNYQGKTTDPVDKIEVWPWMPDHGHGGGAPIIIEKVATGTYLIRDIFFIMPGYWDMHIKVGNDEIKFGLNL